MAFDARVSRMFRAAATGIFQAEAARAAVNGRIGNCATSSASRSVKSRPRMR